MDKVTTIAEAKGIATVLLFSNNTYTVHVEIPSNSGNPIHIVKNFEGTSFLKEHLGVE